MNPAFWFLIFNQVGQPATDWPDQNVPVWVIVLTLIFCLGIVGFVVSMFLDLV